VCAKIKKKNSRAKGLKSTAGLNCKILRLWKQCEAVSLLDSLSFIISFIAQDDLLKVPVGTPSSCQLYRIEFRGTHYLFIFFQTMKLNSAV
jgi:hypothetical protein